MWAQFSFFYVLCRRREWEWLTSSFLWLPDQPTENRLIKTLLIHAALEMSSSDKNARSWPNFCLWNIPILSMLKFRIINLQKQRWSFLVYFQVPRTKHSFISVSPWHTNSINLTFNYLTQSTSIRPSSNAAISQLKIQVRQPPLLAPLLGNARQPCQV